MHRRRAEHGHGEDLVGEAGPKGDNEDKRYDPEDHLGERQDREEAGPAGGGPTFPT